jgi:hypothetical protein
MKFLLKPLLLCALLGSSCWVSAEPSVQPSTVALTTHDHRDNSKR